MLKIHIRSKDLSFKRLIGSIVCPLCEAKILFYALDAMNQCCPYCKHTFELYNGLLSKNEFDMRRYYHQGGNLGLLYGRRTL